MTRTECIKGLRLACGGDWMDQQQFMTYCGYKSPQSVTPMLHGLKRFNKKYSVYDLADMIMAGYK